MLHVEEKHRRPISCQHKPSPCLSTLAVNYMPPTSLQQADLILHVGLNARLEATMLNVRIRQRWLRGGLTVGTIGAPVRLTYDAENLGLTPASLVELAEGKVSIPLHSPTGTCIFSP